MKTQNNMALIARLHRALRVCVGTSYDMLPALTGMLCCTESQKCASHTADFSLLFQLTRVKIKGFCI